MQVPQTAEVVISIYLPESTGPATYHFLSRQHTYYGAGDHASDDSGAALRDRESSWFFLSGLDVLTTGADDAVVVLGDSISDGFGARFNANHRLSDRLADRLEALPDSERAPGVLNLSLTGNALRHDGVSVKFPNTGISALARLDRDVFAQTGVSAVIVELGINDIWIYKDSPDAIISALRQLALRVRQRGLLLIVFTLSPWQGYTAWTQALDATRIRVNDYIRTSPDIDLVVDADRILQDAQAPSRLRDEVDSGDHIHPNDAGLVELASAVPLEPLLR
jgi:lysophospholipase L1-like esterase